MQFIQTNADGVVEYTHYYPFDKEIGLGKSKETLESEGFLVESVPEYVEIEGKDKTLKYSPVEGFTIEYNSRPLTTDEQLKQAQNDIGALLFDKAMDKMKTMEFDFVIGTLVAEIAMLKMMNGGIK